MPPLWELSCMPRLWSEFVPLFSKTQQRAVTPIRHNPPNGLPTSPSKTPIGYILSHTFIYWMVLCKFPTLEQFASLFSPKQFDHYDYFYDNCNDNLSPVLITFKALNGSASKEVALKWNRFARAFFGDPFISVTRCCNATWQRLTKVKNSGKIVIAFADNSLSAIMQRQIERKMRCNAHKILVRVNELILTIKFKICHSKIYRVDERTYSYLNKRCILMRIRVKWGLVV